MSRVEFEQRNLDIVEEKKLVQLDAVQANLRGMWRDLVGGCPHRHGQQDWPDLCDFNDHICVYETGDGPCKIFQQILEEWRIEYEICPECCEVRLGDERVRAGMKCGLCAR